MFFACCPCESCRWFALAYPDVSCQHCCADPDECGAHQIRATSSGARRNAPGPLPRPTFPPRSATKPQGAEDRS